MSTQHHQKVVVSGYVFANIVHEASKSDNDTEGFLCGNVKKTVKDQITDSDASGNQHELEFALHDILPLEGTFSFYGNLGKISMDSTDYRESKTILGWYKIRRNSSCRISMRERTVIRNLLNRLSLDKGLIFILCTPQSQKNRSTTSFAYKCFYCREELSCPVGLKVSIVSLGHTGTHPEYRNSSALIEPLPKPGSVSHGDITSATVIPHICDSFEQTFMRSDNTVYEVHHIRKMYNKTVNIMKQFQENISETEKDIEEHEREISQLKRRLGLDHESSSESEETSRRKTDENGEDDIEMGEERSARIALSRIQLKSDNNDDDDNSETDFTQSPDLSSQEL